MLLLDDLTTEAPDKPAQHRPRCDAARRNDARLRRGASAASSRQYRGQGFAAAITTSSSVRRRQVFPRWLRPNIGVSSSASAWGAASRLSTSFSAEGSRRIEHAARRAGRRGQEPARLQFVAEAVRRGGKAAISSSTRNSACCSIAPSRWASTSPPCGIGGRLSINQLDAAELRRASSPTLAWSSRIPTVKTVVIDSLNGYQAAMPQENSLILHMHELLQSLNRQGVSTFLTVAQDGLRRHELAGRRDLPRRHRDAAALLRGGGVGPPRPFRCQEAHRRRTKTRSANSGSTAACGSASRSPTFRACAGGPSAPRRPRAAPPGALTEQRAPPLKGNFARRLLAPRGVMPRWRNRGSSWPAFAARQIPIFRSRPRLSTTTSPSF